ncbi:hypothetical protein GCM10027271_03720 [Saccharopolyspora gloriosae]|uniref:Caspase domain-containing protein n=1 Tax=Saccharopolyspora gloriosae TaxID=455344 RepID=A0A840NRZ9_9PSEU|nr:caspase family protein [Saccharopolyspora gloriosae]MBB5071922.1 hypothetical protein [Saccharopolyspora gloriosae]
MTGHALFIGVSEYESDGFDSYPTVGESARKLHDLFDASSLWDASRLVENPIRGRFMDELRSTLDECGPSDSALVYFCGHGDLPPCGRTSRPELHLALSDSKPHDASTQLPVHHVYEALETCLASKKVLVLDCCECGQVPMLSHVDVEMPEFRDERTWVLKALRWGESYAKAIDGDRGVYTAFSGALIKILDGGLPDASNLLDIDEVFTELERNLHRDRHPVPDMIRRGRGSLALLENSSPEAKQRIQDELESASLFELAAMLDGGADLPAPAIEQQLRARLRTSENAIDLAHQLHERPALHRGLADVLMTGAEDVAGDSARQLSRSACPDCAHFAQVLLERAVELDANRFAEFHRALVAGEPEVTRLEQDLAGLVTGERLAALVSEPEEPAAEAADRLLGLFAAERRMTDLQEVLTALYARGEQFAVETVLANVALGRSAVDAAKFAQLQRDAAEREIGKLVVRKRLPQDVAAYVAAFDLRSESVMRGLLAVAVKTSSSHDLIRLARALRSRGFADAPAIVMERALHDGAPPQDVCDLLDGLAGSAPDQRTAIEELFLTHLRGASVEELETYLSRKDFLGRSDALVRDVVADRPIDDVIALHRHAADEDAELAWNITHAVAGSRKPSHLVQFALACPRYAEQLFTAVGRQRDGDDIGLLLRKWHEDVDGLRHSVPLATWFAAVVPPEVLLDAREFLVGLGKKESTKPVDDVLRMVLHEHALRLAPQELAALLVALPAPSSRKLSEITVPLVRKLDEEFKDLPVQEQSEEPGEDAVTLTYLARVVAAVSHYDHPVAEDLVARIDGAVYNRDDAALHRRYAKELGESGAPGRERDFRRRIDS